MPAIVVRAAVPQDFDAIIDLVAGMFQDLGTTVFPDACAPRSSAGVGIAALE